MNALNFVLFIQKLDIFSQSILEIEWQIKKVFDNFNRLQVFKL